MFGSYDELREKYQQMLFDLRHLEEEKENARKQASRQTLQI
jgi:hypothetical protein